MIGNYVVKLIFMSKISPGTVEKLRHIIKHRVNKIPLTLV